MKATVCPLSVVWRIRVIYKGLLGIGGIGLVHSTGYLGFKIVGFGRSCEKQKSYVSLWRQYGGGKIVLYALGHGNSLR
jgi:hypothetical protein